MNAQHDDTTTPASAPTPAPEPPAAADGATYDDTTTHPARRGWRSRLPRGRSAVVVGAAAAVLAVGGVGFGAGYAVGDHGASVDQATTQQVPGFDRDGDGFGGPPDGRIGGPMDGSQLGGQADGDSGTTGQAPDFDGDGQPDSSGTDSGSTDSNGTDLSGTTGQQS
ncbi:hypothetical protein [Nocardioides sp. Soil805]|uniref:hypothetical protein n=1 Tax=Nocardioides sp. Soil805 TaxID=1736416 RepID=UPI0007027C95|nr:hypothetical protein [Nocardioides sp. Soil805]KRF37671.1 hypothetical protein ASG94_10355 [Nocardioides sp. Soil805]